MINSLLIHYVPCSLLIGFLFLAGCNNHSNRYSVSGTVQIGGEAVEDGMISFCPVPDGSTSLASGSASITAGRYKLQDSPGLTSGDYTIRIIATRQVPGKTEKVQGMIPGKTAEVPLTENLVPDDFGPRSKHVVTITSGKNVFDFDIPKRVE